MTNDKSKKDVGEADNPDRTALAQSNLGYSPSPASTPGGAPKASIRRATLSDAAVIADIGSRVFDETFAHTCTADDMNDYLSSNFTEQVISEELKDDNKVFTVACVNDVVAAFSVLTTGTSEPCVEQLERRIEIQRVYADSAFQGKGVARTLMEATLDLAKELGNKWAWLGVWESNHKALAFYTKFGFTKVGEHDFMLGNDRQTDYIYVKEL